MLLLAALGIVLLLGTQSGRVWLAQQGLSAAAQRLDGQLHWQGLAAPGMNHWRLEKLSIAGRGLPGIDATGIDLYWRPRQLLRGRLVLETLRLDRLAVAPASTQTRTTSTSTSVNNAPALPLQIRTLSIGSLVLPLQGGSIPGEWRVSGAVSAWQGDAFVSADLSLSPKGAAWGRFRISARVAGDGDAQVNGWYSETAQGPLSAALHLPEAEPLEASYQARLEHASGAYLLDLREIAFSLPQHDLNINGKLRLEGGTVSSAGLHLDVDGERQLLTGRVAGDELDLRLQLAGLPLDLATPWVPGMPGGRAEGRIDIHGPWSKPQAAGKLVVHSAYRDRPVTLDINASADRDQLRIEQSVIDAGDGVQARAVGTVDFLNRSLDLNADMAETDLQLIRSLGITVPGVIAGKLAAHTRVQGPWERPQISVQGSFNGVYKDSVPLVLNIDAATRVPRHEAAATEQQPVYELAVKRLDLGLGQQQLQGHGRVMASLQPLTLDILDAYLDVAGTRQPLWGKIRGDQLDLGMSLKAFPADILAPLLGTPVTGAVSGKVLVAGSFSDPRLQADIDSDLTLRGVPVHIDAVAKGRWNRLEISSANLRSGTGKVAAQGVVDLAGDATRLQLNASDVDTGLLRQIDGRIPAQLHGRLQADLTVTGSLDQVQVAGTAGFSGDYEQIPVQLSLTGSGARERFNIAQLELTSAEGGRLALHGSYDPGSGAHIDVNATALPAQLLRWHDWSLPPGQVDGTLAVSGTPRQPAATGKLSYRRAETAQEKAGVLSAINAAVTLDQEDFDVQMSLAGENARTGNIRITLPWRRYLQRPETQALEQTPLAGSIHAEAHLQELCALLLDTDIHDCRGAIKADLSLGNTLHAPRFDGTIVLNDGYYENLVSGTSLNDINMEVKAAGNSLQVIRATAGDGDKGRLALEGEAHWRDSIHDLDVNLLMRATDAHLLRRYDMDGIANGTLTLTGGLKELYLSGGLEIRPFTLSLQALLQEDIPTLTVSNDDTNQVRVQASRQKWQWLPAVNLNVQLSAEQQAFLRGQGLEAELQGKIMIQGQYPDTSYRGSFRTVRGNVHILGKKFTLEGGEVRMENQVYSLLIPAVYRGKDIEVHAQLSGTVDELHLDLSSSPVYPEDEIVSRLLFNKSAENISPLQAIRLANAISILKFGGKPLFDPLSKIQKTLTVDSLNVEDAENGNGVMLGVGKYITEKVYVEVETGTGAGEPWQGNIQIELLPNLNLENTINGETGFGNIELQWKKDY